MKEWLKRTLPVYKEEGLKKLENSRVVLLGVGGVGSSCAEALVRSGVGNILIVDNDTVDITNLNRQLVAVYDNVGNNKVEEMRKRMLSINPHCNIEMAQQFYLPDNCEFVYDYKPDFIIDAIDTVTAKLHLIEQCNERNIPLITCLGTGNRLRPELLTLGDISDTVGCGCPLARVMRQQIKKMGIKKSKVVFSTELPAKTIVEGSVAGRHSPCSVAYVPPVAGHIMAGYVVRSLLGIE